MINGNLKSITNILHARRNKAIKLRQQSVFFFTSINSNSISLDFFESKAKAKAMISCRK